VSRRGVRYTWAAVAAAVLAVAAGAGWVLWSRSGPGAGLYSRLWRPEPVHAYWAPADFYTPPRTVAGRFEGGRCVACHEGVTPGIVRDWRASRHAAAEPRVGCSACHGADHERLRMPTPAVCGGCHERQHRDVLEERRWGFPSHALALERAVEAPHFVDKPKAEVAACLQCHSVAQKCDSCHTRHRFSAAEARRPEACMTCHSGPPHPDDATYFASAHGRRYLAEGDRWDWSRPLRKGGYPAPTCAYCHMHGGRHQVADKAIWRFGIVEVNPDTSVNRVKRRRWVAVCADCHDPAQARGWLRGLDAERRAAWRLLYAAERLLRALRAGDLLHPGPGERPPYPNSRLDRLWPRARIGFYEGQASAFFNVSPIERDYFEMWYFDNLAAYKAAAHGDAAGVRRAHAALRRRLEGIRAEAARLRALGAAERRRLGRRLAADPALWLAGPYTTRYLEEN